MLNKIPVFRAKIKYQEAHEKRHAKHMPHPPAAILHHNWHINGV